MAPGAGEGDVAGGDAQNGHHDRHGLEAEGVTDDAAAHEGDGGSHGAEGHLPGHDVHPVLGADSDLGEERLEGAAR